MNQKQFLILVVTLVVLGGAGFALFWQELADYRASGAKIGAKLVKEIKVADVAQIELKDANSKVTLARKDTGWVVQERSSYPADFKAISDLIIKLIDLKVVQAETVGESLWPRVELLEPAKMEKGGTGAGTQVELKDASGKNLVNVIVGKTILKKDPGNPLPSAQNGVPAGRYIRMIGTDDKVVVVSDPLTQVDAQPGRWLDKRFPKADRVKTLSVVGDGINWKVARGQEWEPWKFATGGGDLNPTAAVTAANALNNMSFKDVVMNAKPEDEGKPVIITAETFDNLTYVFKLAKRKTGDDYLLNVTVTGEPPAARPPEKNEKAEDAARRDKEFAEGRKRLEARVAIEKMLGNWSYVVAGKEVEALLKPREQLVAPKRGKEPEGVR